MKTFLVSTAVWFFERAHIKPWRITNTSNNTNRLSVTAVKKKRRITCMSVVLTLVRVPCVVSSYFSRLLRTESTCQKKHKRTTTTTTDAQNDGHPQYARRTYMGDVPRRRGRESEGEQGCIMAGCIVCSRMDSFRFGCSLIQEDKHHEKESRPRHMKTDDRTLRRTSTKLGAKMLRYLVYATYIHVYL